MHPFLCHASGVGNEKDVDRLYSLPLAEFTAQRDALAKRLRKDGDRDAADEVKRLKKPSEPAWAVNQLARNNRRELNALLKAGERLRDAQTGGAGRDELRAAIAAEREQVGKLAALAEPLLDPSSEAKLERVRNTLHAAAVDDETREQVEVGRLVADAEAVGLGLPGLGAGGGASKQRPGRESESKPRSKPKSAQKSKPKPAQESKPKPAQRSKALPAGNRRAQRAIETARKRERDARERADRARTELKYARAAAEEAAKALQTAERRVKEAEARESDAQDRLAEAQANRPV
jgi:hypothetical protein